MKTKTIPFDLETAKKIQAGEIKGKILNNLKNEVRIVCFDREDALVPIIALFKVDGGEGVMYVKKDGHAVNCRDILVIELPEAMSMENHPTSEDFKKGFGLGYDAGYLKGKEDAIEFGEKVKYPAETEETSKQYPYDRVKDKITDADRQEAEKSFPDSYNMQSAFISGVAYQICKEIDCSKLSKHGFKPFDKVLVRNKVPDMWHPSLYATTDGLLYYTIDCKNWCQCVKYEGNEHLVGTTDNPKEK